MCGCGATGLVPGGAEVVKLGLCRAPGLAIYGRDLYVHGQADMLIKLMGLFMVVSNYKANLRHASYS